VREIVDYMEKKTVPAGTHIIREGDTGDRQK
jgi:CRP-like cAMP-binding protein